MILISNNRTNMIAMYANHAGLNALLIRKCTGLTGITLTGTTSAAPLQTAEPELQFVPREECRQF